MSRTTPGPSESTVLRPAACFTRSLLALGLCAGVPLAHAQVYKCEDGAGKTIYADAPCSRGGKTLKLPSDTSGSPTGRTICAQLFDERRRLAAESDRAAKRGRTESTSSARRRQALTRQYESRCIGIARSGR